MVKALWNGVVLAEADATVELEGNHYFPPHTVNMSFLHQSATTTECAWKGTAHYYTVVVNGKANSDAAWYYPNPKSAASRIRDHIAFWKGVKVA
ncbi:MAG: DUF427 domain-containing protein [Alphaproteobacteria bacterium]|nr:DUF427 domain-containing protein [Alphaproteobacteria bacterium]MDE2496064.1 DUF427 domain-containing protein [Alphaproteobacteria bacterium]